MRSTVFATRICEKAVRAAGRHRQKLRRPLVDDLAAVATGKTRQAAMATAVAALIRHHIRQELSGHAQRAWRLIFTPVATNAHNAPARTQTIGVA